KPSNVLVRRDGRVVVLDFGLVVDVDPTGMVAVKRGVGTPAYMAPEQAAGMGVGPPADWYAVGVLLFQALTGRLPFLGSNEDILHNKHRFDAPSPCVLAPGIPGDLALLCQHLLRIEPMARATG